MSLVNKYLGATITPGASNLDRVGILTVEEGYNLGNTIEYVNIGDFRITTTQPRGSNQERITIAANGMVSNSNDHNPPLSLEFPSYVRLYDPFDSSDTFFSRYTTSSYGVTFDASNSLVKFYFQGASSYRSLVWNQGSDLENVRILAKVSRNATDSSAGDIITLLRYQADNNTMRIRYSAGIVYYEYLNAISNNFTVITSTSGVSLGTNGDYYMMTLISGNRLIHAGSSNGVNYTKHIDSTAILSQTTLVPYTGKVGMAAIGASAGVISLKQFEVSSLNNQLTLTDAQENIFAANGNFQVAVQRDLDGFGNMVSNSGSCWVSGVSGSISRISNITGSSWDTLMTTGATFNNFILECEASGVSGANIGLLFGSTSNFYLAFHDWSNGTNEGVEQYNNGRFTRTSFSSHVTMQTGVVYSLKLVKQDIKATWFVNGMEQNIILGQSLSDIFANNVRVGIGTFNNIGGSVTISNLRISVLDDPVSDFRIENNDNLSDLSDRYLPSGFSKISSGAFVKIFKRGSSNGLFSLGPQFSLPIVQSDYKSLPSLTSVTGNNIMALVGNTGYLISKYFSNTKVIFINDENIQSTFQASNLAIQSYDNTNLNRLSLQIETDLIPPMERFDKVTLSDTNLPIDNTAIFVIDDIQKQYDVATGRYRSNLTINLLQ